MFAQELNVDRFWANKEIYCDYKADISSTGSRCNYEIAFYEIVSE